MRKSDNMGAGEGVSDYGAIALGNRCVPRMLYSIPRSQARIYSREGTMRFILGSRDLGQDVIGGDMLVGLDTAKFAQAASVG